MHLAFDYSNYFVLDFSSVYLLKVFFSVFLFFGFFKLFCAVLDSCDFFKKLRHFTIDWIALSQLGNEIFGDPLADFFKKLRHFTIDWIALSQLGNEIFGDPLADFFKKLRHFTIEKCDLLTKLGIDINASLRRYSIDLANGKFLVDENVALKEANSSPQFITVNGNLWVYDIGSSFNYDFSKEPEGFIDLEDPKIKDKIKKYQELEIKNNNGAFIKALPKRLGEKTWTEFIHEHWFAYNVLLTVIGVGIGYYWEMSNRPYKDPRFPDW